MNSGMSIFARPTSAVARTPNDVWDVIFEFAYVAGAQHLYSICDAPAVVCHTLCLVCKAWKRRTLRLPHMWRSVCVFPFEWRDAGPRSLLKYQMKQARRLSGHGLHISTLLQHHLSTNAVFMDKRVHAFLDEIVSPRWISGLRSLHITVDATVQMERILSCLWNGLFARLETISLTMRRSADAVLPRHTLRGVHFSNLRRVELKSVIIEGLCFLNNVPTSLDVTIGTASARHNLRPVWALAETAGASRLTSRFNIARCDKMLLPGNCDHQDNLTIVDLTINAGCTKILLGSGSFQNVITASFTDIPDLEEFMDILFWGRTADPFSTSRHRSGGALLPRLQSLRLDLCTSRRTFAKSWRRLFQCTTDVVRFTLKSSFPMPTSNTPRSVLLVMDLAAGGVEMWPHLTRLSIRDRPDVIFESCLRALMDVFAGEGWAVMFDLDGGTHEYMMRKGEQTDDCLRKIAETFEQGLS